MHGKLRVAFSFRSHADVAPLPPVLLRDAAQSAPAAWRSTLSALLDLGESIDSPPRVFGALLWEHATGLPYLTSRSDLDLLWSARDAPAAASLLAGLRRLDIGSPVRLDGELELPDGGGVNWREISSESGAFNGEALVKTMNRVEMRKVAALFCANGFAA
jgi:phosphoribosyl-dephospho-CoA transferase